MGPRARRRRPLHARQRRTRPRSVPATASRPAASCASPTRTAQGAEWFLNALRADASTVDTEPGPDVSLHTLRPRTRLAARAAGHISSGGGHFDAKASRYLLTPRDGPPAAESRARLELQTKAATPCAPPRGARRHGRSPHPSRRTADPRRGRPVRPAWPDGVVHVYDADGMRDTMITAAERWTARAPGRRSASCDREEDADVIVRVDDRRLLELCGRDCLGYSTSIGRPGDGPQRGPAALQPRRHAAPAVGLGRRARARARARPAPPLRPRLLRDVAARVRHALRAVAGRLRPTADELACVPAPADVDVAAGLYGGAAATRDPRCS